MRKPRLVKVEVHPVFMMEEDDVLTEVDHAVVVVPAKEWADYSGTTFPLEVAEWQKRLNEEDRAAEEPAPKPSRGKKKDD